MYHLHLKAPFSGWVGGHMSVCVVLCCVVKLMDGGGWTQGSLFVTRRTETPPPH